MMDFDDFLKAFHDGDEEEKLKREANRRVNSIVDTFDIETSVPEFINSLIQFQTDYADRLLREYHRTYHERG